MTDPNWSRKNCLLRRRAIEVTPTTPPPSALALLLPLYAFSLRWLYLASTFALALAARLLSRLATAIAPLRLAAAVAPLRLAAAVAQLAPAPAPSAPSALPARLATGRRRRCRRRRGNAQSRRQEPRR